MKTVTLYDAEGSSEAAEKLYHSKLKEKLAKGYRPGADSARLAAQCRGPHLQDSGDCKAYDRQPGTSYGPMLLNSVGPAEAETLIRDPNWFMQQKADGIRAIVTIDCLEGTVRATSRTGKPVALTVAIINALNHVFPRGAVLDVESCGETLVIFDVLRLGARDLSGCSCELRLRRLETISRRNKYARFFFIQTARTEVQKRNALKLLVDGGAEGVVFKDRNALYSAGRPHTGGPALKWKFRASASVVIARHHREGKRSVEIALRDGTPVGHVTLLAKHGRLPLIGTIIEVGYLYAFRGGGLAQSVYKGIRSDVDADGAGQISSHTVGIP